MTLTKAIEQLEMEINNAFEVARTNKENGEPAQSVAYDGGRITGLRDAVEIIGQVHMKQYGGETR